MLRNILILFATAFLVSACTSEILVIENGNEENDASAAYRPAWLNEDERTAARALKADGWFPYDLTPPPDVQVTPPPEWSDLEGIFLRWPTGWPELKPTYHEIVNGLQDRLTVTIVVSSENALDQAWDNILTCDGCRPGEIRWLIAPTDSIWMRDYGPQFVHYPDGELAVVNLSYFPNRTEDDLFPARYAPFMNLPLYTPGLYIEGGNFQTDGAGRCVVSEYTPEINGYEHSLFQLQNYLGCRDVEFVSYMIEEGTRHMDMWIKFLNEEDVIVGDYRLSGEPRLRYPDNTNADILDEVAEQLDNIGYRVTRIPMPPTYLDNIYNQYVFRSYTNSVLANGSLLLPMYDISTDAEAYLIYRNLLPYTEIIPIDTSYVIEFGGSLHCMTVENHKTRTDLNDSDMDADSEDTDDDSDADSIRCEFYCVDYNFNEGECYSGWTCINGCLYYTGDC